MPPTAANDPFSTFQGGVEKGGEGGDKTFSTTTPYRVGGGGGGGGPQGGGGEPPPGVAPANQFGPWAADLDPAEHRARLRCLRAVVHLSTGPRGKILTDLLRQAESDPAALEPALHALDRLAGLDRRHVLASYAALNRPVV